MGQVSIEVNGRAYLVGCEDGQENHLREIGRLFDRQVKQVAQEVGALGDTRLMLMGALMIADDLSDLRGRVAAMQAELNQAKAQAAEAERNAAAALEAAAARIEALAGSGDEA